MSAYALTARAFSEFRERDPETEGLAYWEDLVDSVGGVLPFLIRRECMGEIPFDELSLPKIDPSKLGPKAGEMWVLFCLLQGDRDKGTSPLRSDGFPLVLEWRKGVADSPLLSTAFHQLADLVRRQQGVSGWGLCPAYSRYGDQIAFTDPQLFANCQDSMFVASAYGALAAGLVCATAGKHPHGWPFPTMQWDEKHHDLIGVVGLRQKFSVAADFGATVVTVAHEQANEAKKTLKTLRQGTDGRRFDRLRICSVSGRGKFVDTARRIAFVESRIFRRRCAVMALLALLLLNVGGLAYWLDWQREKITYFADWVDRFGVFEGVGQLSKRQLSGRSQAYRFHCQGYDSLVPWRRKPVLRGVYCVNSFDVIRNDGKLALPPHRPMAGRRFLYREDRSLAAIEGLEVDGTRKEIYSFGRRDAGIVDIIRRGGDGRFGTAKLAIAEGAETCLDELGRYRIDRNKDGYATRIESYRRGQNVPVPDEYGVYRTDYRVDALGRVVEETYFSWNGQPVTRDGDDGRQFIYDEEGNLTEVRHLKDGKTLWAELQTFDENGNCIQVVKNAPSAKHLIEQWAKRKLKYDSNGELILVEHFGSDGELAKLNNARWIRKPTLVNGRLVAEEDSYFNWRNEPGSDGQSFRCVKRYDDNIRRIEVVRYGQDGQPLSDENASAVEKWRYDSEGRERENVTLNADGTPWRCAFGYSRATADYEELSDGILKTVRYFAFDDQPVCETKRGAAIEEIELDVHGRIRRIGLYDEKGEAIIGSNKWHSVVFRHDRLGYLERISYYGKTNECVLADGFGTFGCDVGSIRFIHDELGHVAEISLWGVDDKRMNGFQGWATVKRIYDKYGRLTDEALFDADGNAVAPRGGINSRTHFTYGDNGKLTRRLVYSIDGNYREFEYDQQGWEMKDSAYSADGTPILDEDGIHAIMYRRDEVGREVKKGYLNVEGKPTLDEDRVAGVMTRYNEKGDVCEQTNFGVNGELVRDINGVCIVRQHFDENHRDLGHSFYDENTNRVANTAGVAGVRKAYDAAGNKTEEYNVGIDDRARPNGYGVSIAHSDFDSSGRAVKVSLYDADRRPVLNSEGIGGWVSGYEKNSSHEVTRHFFDLEGKPCVCTNGSAGWMKEYDSHGNVIKFVRIGLDGQPSVDGLGSSGWFKKYDKSNRCIEERSLAEDGNSFYAVNVFDGILMNTVAVERVEYSYGANGVKSDCIVLAEASRGIGRIVRVYNVSGDMVEMRFENNSGRLTALPSGVAKIKAQYNDLHELTMREWYDEIGRRSGLGGVCKMVLDYDRTQGGLRLIANNYDKDGFPAADGSGVASKECKYDRDYRLLYLKSLDANKQPVCAKGENFAECTITRDECGRVVRLVCFDEKGQGAACGIARFEMSYSVGKDGAVLVSHSGFDVEGKKLGEINNVPYWGKEMAWLRMFAERRYQRIK